MTLAAILFFLAGVLNDVYPGGAGWEAHGGYGWLTYLFGLLNLAVAVWIWRGSERGLVTRIVLGAVFLAIVAALALAQPTTVSLVLYVVTGLIELVILLNAVRVWQAARDAESGAVDRLLSLDAPLPITQTPRGSLLAPPAPDHAATAAEPLSALLTWVIGVLPLALALVLVSTAALAGYVPGGLDWSFTPTRAGWLAYLLALVELVVAVRAVHGSRLAIGLLLAMSILVAFERAYAPLAFGGDTLDVWLHVVAAALAVVTAIVAAVALRQIAQRRPASGRLERAISAE